uniref:hypothetical protein n=1 Tax=Inonotus hispidus TaxID=40469 RepID=UPI002182571E|nr:hypothetical protein N4M07_mgp062 [Inonotus hispidus]UVF37990.1 hypothetical protein [Inonotus hispidus]
MRNNKILLAVIILLTSALITLFVLDFLFDLKADSLIAASDSNNVTTINNQLSVRNLDSVKNVANTLTSNVSETTTNHTDFKDPATIALLSITSVLVLVVLCGTGLLIYNYLQLPLEAQQNIDTIELQNM